MPDHKFEKDLNLDIRFVNGNIGRVRILRGLCWRCCSICPAVADFLFHGLGDIHERKTSLPAPDPIVLDLTIDGTGFSDVPMYTLACRSGFIQSSACSNLKR